VVKDGGRVNEVPSAGLKKKRAQAAQLEEPLKKEFPKVLKRKAVEKAPEIESL